jgi:opacity protein-like surface antigen
MHAQESSRLTYDFGAGFTQTVGNTGRNLNAGWNIQGGPTYNFSPYFGAKLQLGYDSFGVNSVTLSNLGSPDGSLHIFSATVDPIVHLRPHGRIDPYLIGGYGLYHRTQEFTQPATDHLTAANPFFGGISAASYSVNKPGVNGGAGLEFSGKGRWKVFAEARYDRIFLGSQHTDYIPVSFGVHF